MHLLKGLQNFCGDYNLRIIRKPAGALKQNIEIKKERNRGRKTEKKKERNKQTEDESKERVKEKR